MTAPARLLSVKLQGFKSFADRTHVDFGPGISAVVGPNGSGKSNLADALRWALGEQGRALRTRRSEDVIWAGSERRPALGMADVQLVLDNADGLLPVEFGVVELGRRLFRSGENEYVLNRQRVRLRDLVDLLDAAHLAENAFLFIGQGMVDQALALRPEERRPLFEEVAGVRRHERRRRRAEEQLAEAEANLARVDDIVLELRPQVRRLAAQAEQQTNWRAAADDLAAALVEAAHARWHAAASRVASADAALAEQRAAAEAAMRELTARETAAAGFADRLAERSTAAAGLREEVDVARERLTSARLAAGALDAEAAALARDRSRLSSERAAVEAELEDARRDAGASAPVTDVALEAELRDAELALSTAIAERSRLQAAGHAEAADRLAAAQATARRQADLDLARRRHDERARELADEVQLAEQSEATSNAAAADHALTTAARSRAAEAHEQAIRDLDAAIADDAAATAALAAAAARSASAEVAATAAADRLSGLRARLREGGDGLAAAAQAVGGRPIAEGLEVDPTLASAVAAALGARGAGFVVDRSMIGRLSARHGSVVAREAVRPAATAQPTGDRSSDALLTAVRAAGGGALADAVTRDETGAARRLLSRAVWLPDLESCLQLQATLPAGWIALPRDGSAIVADAAVELRPDEGALARRAEVEALAARTAVLRSEADSAAAAHAAAVDRRKDAQSAVLRARTALSAAVDGQRAAEAAEATAGRRSEAASREAAWHAAQVGRLEASAERAAETLRALEAEPAEALDDANHGGDEAHELAVLGRRIEELQGARDRAADAWRIAEAARRDADRRRAASEASVAIAERRLGELGAALDAAVARSAGLGSERADAAVALEAATAAAESAGRRLDAVLALDAEDRAQLGGAERAAVAARAVLREVQEAARAAEHVELEARLGLESLREQLLVELAGLGELGLGNLGVGQEGDSVARALPSDSDHPVVSGDELGEPSADVARLEAALDAAAARWAVTPAPTEVPSPGRLGSLRRRFHELGAANPFAVEEHAELAARLTGLETQRDDLLAAVGRTRALIGELDELIASQFRTTFGALERAFDARFQQLFGGGFARLTLTEPGDLATTGVEITARPPGKKPQALAMLSGGERALTAVALLFAMLEVRPVPFCVLDEVDAALDEANIGRFTDALRELARATQFVVITHNRGTIEIADALYGVTVTDDSVSRVISLRLEDATAIAEAAAVGRRRAPIIPAGLSQPAADPADDTVPPDALEGVAESPGPG